MFLKWYLQCSLPWGFLFYFSLLKQLGDCVQGASRERCNRVVWFSGFCFLIEVLVTYIRFRQGGVLDPYKS